jgi:hypothetical protein
MKVQEGSGSSPLQSSSVVLTLHQAVMTSSVHDIDSPLVALVSLFPESMYDYWPKQNRALLIFKALGLMDEQPSTSTSMMRIVYVDGSNPSEKERRNELFELSGKRGVFPQLFIRRNESNNELHNSTTTGGGRNNKLEFFADFDKIELLNDCQTLKEEIEKAITSR